MRFKYGYFIFCLILFSGNFLFSETNKKLTVGVYEYPPYIIKHNDLNSYTGLTSFLWQTIAEDNKLDYSFVLLEDNLKKNIELLKSNKIDVLAGPLFVTHDMIDKSNFSRSYAIGKIGIITQKKQIGLFSLYLQSLKEIFSSVFWIVLVALIISIHIFWLVERKKTTDFPSGYFRGIGHVAWMSIVTLLSNGLYENHRSNIAKAIATIWLLMAISLISSIFSTLSSNMIVVKSKQEHRIKNFNDIYGKTFAIANNSQLAQYHVENKIKNWGGKIIYFTSWEKIIKDLLDGEVDGIIGDKPYLKSIVSKYDKSSITTSAVTLGREEMVFATSNNKILAAINKTLLKLRQTNEMFNICQYSLNEHKSIICVF